MSRWRTGGDPGVEVLEDSEQLDEQIDHFVVLEVPPVGDQLRQR